MDTEHDPTIPEHVTRELMKPFPQSALYQRKSFTYVQYQQVIRRLIHATGNNFQTDVRELRIEPWTNSSGGHQQVALLALVTLTIPVLQSSRTQMGIQVATVGFGEDMWKGAVSDGLKKAAQQFGVAIDLAGKDGEDTAPDPAGLPQRFDPPTPAPFVPDHSKDESWQTANRRLHATAGQVISSNTEIAHAALHLMAEKVKRVRSLKHLPANDLDAMRTFIESDEFQTWYDAQIRPNLPQPQQQAIAN